MHLQHGRASEKDTGALRVRVALLQAGLTQAEIARRLSERLGRNVSRQEVNNVVRLRRATGAIRQAICEATGLPYGEL